MAYHSAQFFLAVQSLCPEVRLAFDFDISDTGSGPFISGWRRQDVAQPTLAEIEAVDTDDLLVKRSVPASVTRRQFFTQGAVSGWYSKAEALALLSSNTMPTSIVNYINSLPAEDQYPAKIYILGEAVYFRNSPVLNAMATAGGVTDKQLDSFFINAALIV